MVYDVIVVGVGSMGSSTCYHLSKRGLKVLGLEQFGITHDQGSHFGQTRIIRKAYFEHSDYVPLLSRSYELWRELEKESGVRLFYDIGLAYFGRPGDRVLQGVKKSSELYGIPVDDIPFDAYPQFKLPRDYVGLLEKEAGFVLAERSIQEYVRLALANGTDILTHQMVMDWTNDGDGVLVKTKNKNYRAHKIIFTSGGYVNALLPQEKFKTRTTRQYLGWFQSKDIHQYELGKMPVWLVSDGSSEGAYYGFPYLSEMFPEPAGFKVGRHFPGKEIDPLNTTEDSPEEEIDSLRKFLELNFKVGNCTCVKSGKCIYTLTEDEHFVLEQLNGNPNVVIGTGFSGHGFKFVPVVGEILADLATQGYTDLPIDFLSSDRLMKA